MRKLLHLFITLSLLTVVVAACDTFDPRVKQLAPGESVTIEETFEFAMEADDGGYYAPTSQWMSFLRADNEINGPQGLVMTDRRVRVTTGVLTDFGGGNVSFVSGVIVEVSLTARVPEDGARTGDITLTMPGLTTIAKGLNATPEFLEDEDFLPPDTIKVARVNVSGWWGFRLLAQGAQFVAFISGLLLLSALILYLSDEKVWGRRALIALAVVVGLSIVIVSLPISIPALIAWRVFNPDGFKAFFTVEKDDENDAESDTPETPAVPLPEDALAAATGTAPIEQATRDETPQPIVPDADAQLKQALDLLKKKQVRQGVNLIQDVLKHDPANIDALLLMGRVMERVKKFEQAERYYKKAADLGSDEGQNRLDGLRG